jgi:hypothetical protein
LTCRNEGKYPHYNEQPITVTVNDGGTSNNIVDMAQSHMKSLFLT